MKTIFNLFDKKGEPITKRIVIDTIGKDVADNIKSHGYQYIKSRSHIINKFKEGYHRVILTTWDGFPYSHQQLSISFRLRIDSVEKIVNTFYDSRFMNPEFHNVTDTYDFTMKDLNFENPLFVSKSYKECNLCNKSKKEELLKYNPEEIFIHDTRDIELVTKIISSLMIENAIGYFNKLTDLAYLNCLLKARSTNSSLQGELRTLMQSLTLMKLLKDDDFEKSCNLYPSILKPFHWEVQRSKDALSELIEYLKQI